MECELSTLVLVCILVVASVGRDLKLCSEGDGEYKKKQGVGNVGLD